MSACLHSWPPAHTESFLARRGAELPTVGLTDGVVLGGGGPGDVDGGVFERWWVAAFVVGDLGDGWFCGHGVLMPGGGGHSQVVRGAGVGPTAVFFALVTPFT